MIVQMQLSIVALMLLIQSPARSKAPSDAGAAEAERVVRQIEEGRIVYKPQMREALADIPAETAARVIIGHLESNPKFREPRLRDRAYFALDVMRAEDFQVGLRQLLIGIREGGYGIRALGRLGKSAPVEVVSAIGDHLIQSISNPKSTTLEALARFGEKARPYLDDIDRVFSNGELDKSTRYVALEAMIKIGGISELFPKLEELESGDLDNRRIILGAIAYFGAETKGTYGTDDEHRRKIRKVVLDGLVSVDKEVRQAAIIAVAPAFVEDLFVIRSRDEYEMHPGLREALEQMAKQDDDEVLRGQAGRLLDPVEQDRIVKRILRRRERASEKDSTEAVGQEAPRDGDNR